MPNSRENQKKERWDPHRCQQCSQAVQGDRTTYELRKGWSYKKKLLMFAGVVKNLWVAESSDGAVGAVRPSQQKGPHNDARRRGACERRPCGWTRLREEAEAPDRWRDSWNARALEKSRARQVRCRQWSPVSRSDLMMSCRRACPRSGRQKVFPDIYIRRNVEVRKYDFTQCLHGC